MINGRGEQRLGPLNALGACHCTLPSASPARPFPAARGPPLPGGRGEPHASRRCRQRSVQSANRLAAPRTAIPARYAAGPGGWGRASPADCRIPSRS